MPSDLFCYDGITWRRIDDGSNPDTCLVRADIDQTEMRLQRIDSLDLYLVVEMRSNPLGIDWKIAQ